MPTNPYESPQEAASPSAARAEGMVGGLSRGSLIAWLLAFLSPSVFFTGFALGDLAGLNWNQPGSGRLVYWVPLVSLAACCLIVLMSRASLPGKLVWIVLSLVGMMVQFLVDVIVFGVMGLALHGLDGVQ
jgi:hypothetical protein